MNYESPFILCIVVKSCSVDSIWALPYCCRMDRKLMPQKQKVLNVSRSDPQLSRRARPSRAEKAAATRAALFEAAIKVVGEFGYAETSIARITARAKVAQGTFYNYFDSRQDLLDQLLPAISARLLEYIADRMASAGEDPVARERCRIIAFFEFMEQTPHLFKILHEGEVQAPEGFRQHAELQLESYRRALRADGETGRLRFETEQELDAVAEILMGARAWLSARYCVGPDGNIVQPPAFIVDMYMKFVTGGLFQT